MVRSGLQYHGELYIEYVHMFGYPSSENRKEFNREFYNVHQKLINHREAVVAVGSLHHTLKKWVVPGWAKRSPEMHKMFVDVMTDYKEKYGNEEKPKATAPLLLVELRSQERLEKKQKTLSNQGAKALRVSLEEFLAQQQKLYEAKGQLSRSPGNCDGADGTDVPSAPPPSTSLSDQIISTLKAESDEEIVILEEKKSVQSESRSFLRVKQETAEEIPTKVDQPEISQSVVEAKKETNEVEMTDGLVKKPMAEGATTPGDDHDVDQREYPPSTDVVSREYIDNRMEKTEDRRPLIESVEEEVVILKMSENKRKRRKTSIGQVKHEAPDEIFERNLVEATLVVKEETISPPIVVDTAKNQTIVDDDQLQKRIQQLEKETAEKDAILLELKRNQAKLEEELKNSQLLLHTKDETIQQLSEKFQSLKEKMDLKDIIIRDKERTIQILSSYKNNM